MKDLIFLDTETTGLHEGRLIDLCLSVNGTDPLAIRSKPPVPISIDAMAVNHITEEMVADLPLFPQQQNYADAKLVIEDGILVAHNAPFDIGVLRREGIIAHDFIDTKKAAAILIPESPRHNLQYLRYFLKLNVPATAHTAYGDVLVLIALYRHLEGLLKARGDRDEAYIRSWMMQVSSGR